ncbi:TIM-barrel domain-containing protein [Amycolatopsis pigmentata]|uniref:TIM-barrel domain-containing protein n=1 Tax=Amycolatopsis pigmentata TaxID=450801 RepID=A0ABW5G0A7_9PSEU
MRTRTKRTFRRACALALAGCVVTAGLVPAPAVARPRAQTVTAGNARFQVLSPTLIRTEYSGDGTFDDSPTFNAIGRGSFQATPFTSTTSGGVLTIRTSATTLSYRLGSGPFNAGNLAVRLTSGQTPVQASPWHHLTCPVGSLCEAEDLTLTGLGTASDHSGYTGEGFAAGFEANGSGVSADVLAPAAGTYTLTVRYANGVAGDGQHIPRSLSLSVDGGGSSTLALPTTADWNTWALASVPVTLGTGHHTVGIGRAKADTGDVNIDSLAVVNPGASYPPTSARAFEDCEYGTSCEAESGLATGSARRATDHTGYSGPGFVAELNQGSSLTHRVVDVPADGTYNLNIRYANGVGGDGLHQTRTATVTVGGVSNPMTFPATNDWDTWSTASTPVGLKAGANDVVLGCPDVVSCHINADTIAVTPTGAPAPAPHLALGGYRRALDGVNGDNGNPPTTEGLLHQDGWYLLDDTPSAFYDARAGQVTQRPSRPGGSYQDGYVFGYGHDYKAGLRDLATLTGPPELLPRWAYGVWYSEYIDRTAADYQNTILPRFRSEGVPLDVLVTDTDFKSPSTWNGWEIDRSKFPDPKAFFDWVHAQGLHETLNIHPSILGSDPKFPRANAIAKGKLAQSCGTDCYVFDWADPDQLAAYLDLHAEMTSQGNDFWWLDWCCDGSLSTLAGVTPDAWINQQYAAAMAKSSGGRGFVISRAYGSLQSGGYSNPTGLPTGPWADKRSTIHFTGDTSSTWGTLRMEVGATPGESAATGMSAISHDIGGHNDTTGLPGSETYVSDGQLHQTHKLPDDLYARWVQFAAFQPIERLHSNHSDRLPWQYGADAKDSATRFLNLRENLVPYTYTLAHEAATTGIPVVRPTYLEYPDEPAAYSAAASEYLYGPDVLVAPVTTPGTQATTTVWFPPGQWTDYFTGKTYAGGTTQQVTTDLGTMPVFLRAGGIVTTRSDNVTNDVQNPMTKLTVTVAPGASGTFSLYEDDGTTTNPALAATTRITYTEQDGHHSVAIDPAQGHFPGQVTDREWTVKFLGVQAAPRMVTADHAPVTADRWTWDSATHTLTVRVPARHTAKPIRVSF